MKGDDDDHDDGIDEWLGLRPLTARSVVLSLLLGSHPPRLPVRALVSTGALFDIEDGTLRVALSRMAAADDVITRAGTYALSGRLQGRQARQDRDRRTPTRPWDGSWTVLVEPEGEPKDKAAEVATAWRLAALTATVWMRPDNLAITREPVRPGWLQLTAAPDGDPAMLAERLWDLGGWAAKAEGLITAFNAAPRASRRFVVSAAILRHLRTDPCLPPELTPSGWPGDRLRGAYDRFEAELASLLRNQAPATPDTTPASAKPDRAGRRREADRSREADGSREARARHSSR